MYTICMQNKKNSIYQYWIQVVQRLTLTQILKCTNRISVGFKRNTKQTNRAPTAIKKPKWIKKDELSNNNDRRPASIAKATDRFPVQTAYRRIRKQTNYANRVVTGMKKGDKRFKRRKKFFRKTLYKYYQNW